MTSGRLEAFSDGVLAIIITIMVLELHTPEGADPAALKPLLPVFLAYLLSFAYLAIYWNNHHHLLKLVGRVSGGIMWANVHLLFWLSLIPFATGWWGKHPLEPWPTALYGLALLMPALAWHVLQLAILRQQGPQSRLAAALGRDIKGKLSPAIYFAGVMLSFILPALAAACYVIVALMWLIPDRRFEAQIAE